MITVRIEAARNGFVNLSVLRDNGAKEYFTLKVGAAVNIFEAAEVAENSKQACMEIDRILQASKGATK